MLILSKKFQLKTIKLMETRPESTLLSYYWLVDWLIL